MEVKDFIQKWATKKAEISVGDLVLDVSRFVVHAVQHFHIIRNNRLYWDKLTFGQILEGESIASWLWHVLDAAFLYIVHPEVDSLRRINK